MDEDESPCKKKIVNDTLSIVKAPSKMGIT